MSAAASPAPALPWRAPWWQRLGSSGWTGLLAEELAPRPGRLRRALRLALLASIGFGLMAAAHVESVMGPFFLWAVAAAPRPMMLPREAVRLVLTQGVLLALSVPLAALLVEVPWFYVSFFALFVSTWAYMIRRLSLSTAWLMTGILVVDTFYAAIFDVHGFGWTTAATFAGAAIAVGTILAFDAWLWPDPAEPALLDSVAAGLARKRRRLDQALRAYFDPALRDRLPGVPPISDLPGHLTLLDRIGREGATARQRSPLLGIVTINERLHIEVVRLLVLAREPVPAAHRERMRGEVEGVVHALAAALGELERRVRSRSMLGDPLPERLVEATNEALAALDARAQAVQLHREPGIDPAEVANLSAFYVGLRRMAQILSHRAPYPPLGATARAPRSLHDPEVMHWIIKLAVATVVTLVIALATHSDEMAPALWTVLIVGLPTHGATLRKMALRLGGVLLGGATALLALVIVTPNFQTLLTYMIVCFVVLLACGWAAQSSSRLAYAGSQMGTTFTLVFAGLSPSERVAEPLWRAWAVVLGVLVTATVFRALWPSYASRSMLPRLRRLLRLNLELIPGRGPALDDAELDAREAESMNAITELLAIADDARLEGSASGVNSDAAIDAAGSLRRMAHRLGVVAAGRSQQRGLSAGAEETRRAFEDRLAQRLDSWSGFFGDGTLDAGRAAAIGAAHRDDGLEDAFAAFDSRVTADALAEIDGWPLAARRSALAELETYHRVTQLAADLDRQLAAIPGGGPS